MGLISFGTVWPGFRVAVLPFCRGDPFGTLRIPAVLRFKGIVRGSKVPPQTSRRATAYSPLPSADYYREKAREISSLAWRSRSVEVRLELLQTAELFERMADRVERRLRAAAD
jgi:hypothetical protein